MGRATSGTRTLGDLATMRRRASRGELQVAEVEMLFAELQRLRALEHSVEERRCKLHHVLAALAAHFSAHGVTAMSVTGIGSPSERSRNGAPSR